MTLEEAIKHAEEKAQCGGKCGEDHAQLAEWLKELQKLRTVKTEERKEESAQNVLKDDSVSRKAAIDAVNGVIADYIPTLYGRYEALPLEMAMAIKRLPSVEPTLYGYNIKHLAFVATVMEKEGVTAEYAARTFDDISRILKMVIDEAREKILAEVVKKAD